MARLWYGGTPADFAIDLGADANIVDGTGTSTGLQGSAVLVPTTARVFDVYVDEDLTTVTTDLLDAGGGAITQVTSLTDFAERGGLPRFQGPDGHEGPLWLRVDGGTGSGYRLEPDSTTLFSRVGDLEAIGTTDLADVSDTAPSDGQTLVWNNGLGVYVPAAAAGTGTVTQVAGEGPDGTGNVVAAALLTALGLTSAAADLVVMKARGYMLCAPSGSGYQAKPAGFSRGIFPGTVEPVSGLGDFDLWIRPIEESP